MYILVVLQYSLSYMADMLRMTDSADVFPPDLHAIVRFYPYNQMLALLQYPAFSGTIIDMY